ncbi:MAG: right-handed parallel beta-helix repeat-containing protein [Candidatus Kariarchaeaceae archaeon]
MIRKRSYYLLFYLLFTVNLSFNFTSSNNSDLNSSSNLVDYSIPSFDLDINYTEHEPIVIENDLDLAFYSTRGNGSEIDPYVIERLNITSFSQTCLSINNISTHFIIENNFFQSFFDYIVFFDCISLNDCSTPPTIQNNLFKNGWAGISIQCMYPSTQIVNNFMFNCTTGIVVEDSNYCHIIANHFSENQDGISIYKSIFNNVEQNYFVNNSDGIAIVSTDHTIKDNVFIDNYNGLDMSYNADDNYITSNLFANNSRGINIDSSSSDNFFTFNAFVSNNKQAEDDGYSNTWHDNFWSDYSGSGDYFILGDANSKDTSPTLSSPLAPNATLHTNTTDDPTNSTNPFFDNQFFDDFSNKSTLIVVLLSSLALISLLVLFSKKKTS